MQPISRLWQHSTQDKLGSYSDHLLRHLWDADLPDVGQPDGHLLGPDLPVLLLQRLLRPLPGWQEEEGC